MMRLSNHSALMDMPGRRSESRFGSRVLNRSQSSRSGGHVSASIPHCKWFGGVVVGVLAVRFEILSPRDRRNRRLMPPTWDEWTGVTT